MQRHPAQPHAALDLFRAQLPETDLHALAQIGTEFRCPARWPLLAEGTPAHDLYLIGEGTADVYRNKRKLARIGPGEIVGEGALWSTGVRSATVSAVTGLHGIRVPYDRMPELLDSSDRLASWSLPPPSSAHAPTCPPVSGTARQNLDAANRTVATGMRFRQVDRAVSHGPVDLPTRRSRQGAGT